jgi:tRNA(adenine34) deaminase
MKVYDKDFMQVALAQAVLAAAADEVPVGAVLVHEGEIIAAAHNAPIAMHDPCAHAEILVLRAAGQQLQNYRLIGATLYVTLEPCPMCIAAMIHARIARCVYAASDPKTGACGGAVDLSSLSTWNHHVDIEGGVMQAEASALLKDFFKDRR